MIAARADMARVLFRRCNRIQTPGAKFTPPDQRKASDCAARSLASESALMPRAAALEWATKLWKADIRLTVRASSATGPTSARSVNFDQDQRHHPSQPVAMRIAAAFRWRRCRQRPCHIYPSAGRPRNKTPARTRGSCCAGGSGVRLRRAAITAAPIASIHRLIAVAWLRKKTSGRPAARPRSR